jgi:plasmid stabilization system protein ParE
VTRLVLGAAAQQDVASIKEWYAEQPVPDLDLGFQHELEQTLGKIEEFPSGFQVVHRDIRKANLRRFAVTWWDCSIQVGGPMGTGPTPAAG